jgi:bifunctional non-homologous end joining protein LigD
VVTAKKPANKPANKTAKKQTSKSAPSEAEASKLEAYRAKRDFGLTPEPGGAAEPPVASGGRRFVVQRHRARRLHYDLRLEVDGVLASWAVPKGPTLDPSARLLAVHVEDHPIEYFDFEGVIPKGEYGGGDVIVWDWGAWEPASTDDPAAAIAAGELHFDLHGEKLKGRFLLIRRDSNRAAKEQWLLLHKRDEQSAPGWSPEEHPRSVKTGRTNDEVAAAPEAMWRSDLPAADAEIRLPSEGNPASRDDIRPARAAQTKSREIVSFQPVTEAELAALDALGTRGTWNFQGRELALTNLDKTLFPSRDDEAPVTKRDLIRYHARIAPVMLPFLVDRPINLHRYPNGVDRPGFWHKELPRYAPEWIRRWRNEEADPGDTEVYAVVDSPPALAWMANYGAVELHPWTSRIPDVHRPTWAFIDIDPGTTTTFDDALALARLFRTALEHLGVFGLPKVTGRRGVQIWIPIVDRYTFDETRAWVEKVSRAVGATVPGLVSWAWHKKERGGLARLDYTQNAINKTLVAPYSARPAPGAPVSVPLEWEELDDPDLRPDRWTVGTVLERVAAVGDPFAQLLTRREELPPL